MIYAEIDTILMTDPLLRQFTIVRHVVTAIERLFRHHNRRVYRALEMNIIGIKLTVPTRDSI